MATPVKEEDLLVPTSIHWTIEDVTNWIEEIGFPQYRECFRTNLVNGRKLILADASHLPQLGVTNFEHIKFISASVRDLLGLEAPYWNRSVSLPPRTPMGMFLERKSRTGEYIDGLLYSQHLKGK
ncbi:sterile alpha motif domain-containing protein 15-like [Styela clava]